MNLKAEDYYAGPKNDTYDASLPDYYEFGIQVKGIDVYIKSAKAWKINLLIACHSIMPNSQ
ncbi:MAG TPA: hypothetical protein VFS22_04950 [Flavisolibacter sp.]|nr:hypothetical protein [Flavisolibacter sp.]